VGDGAGEIVDMTDIPELTAEHFQRALAAPLRRRLAAGQFDSAEDIQALRRFLDLSADEFAKAVGISADELASWEAGAKRPDGPALQLLRIAARHPGAFRDTLRTVAS
jgi:DNA-binding transcriptional regulator YiaG